MSGRRTLVRALAGVLVVGLTVSGCANDKPAHKAPTSSATAARSSSISPAPSSSATAGAVGAQQGIVTGPTGHCTCAGGGVYQPGSANDVKPQP